jgi:hypothetical protein
MTENNDGKWSVSTLVGVVGGILGIIVAIITIQSWLNEPDPPVGASLVETSVDSGTGGVFVTYTAVIEGFGDQELPVTYTLYYVQTDAKVPNPEWHEVRVDSLVPNSSRDQGSYEFVVPHTGERAQYYLRIKLYPPGAPENGKLPLDYIDTQPFDML